MAYNIHQINDSKILRNQVQDLSSTRRALRDGVATQWSQKSKDEFNFQNGQVDYYIVYNNEENPIYKIGYCCEPRGIDFPIYLNGKKIEIGKTLMYECQIESYERYNEDLNMAETLTIIPGITTVEVPKGIHFTLDYITMN